MTYTYYRAKQVLYALYVKDRYKNKKKKYNSFQEFLNIYDFKPQDDAMYRYTMRKEWNLKSYLK